jgi:hypothetical protein
MADSCEPAANVRVVRGHTSNALELINVTVAGISIVVIPDDANAYVPMIASCEPAANVTVTRLVHP